MSAVNLDIPDQTDGTNTGSRRNTVDATSIAPDSEHEESFGNNHFTESQRYLPEQLNSSEDLSLFPSTQLAEKVVNEVPHSTKTGIASSHFSQGKAPLPHAYTNGCGAPQASVRQQPHVSGKRRIGSTTSVCTNRSKKSCKSTASQIQEVAGDELCATLLLACLFCRVSDFLPLLSGSFCSCPSVPACGSKLLGICSDSHCCYCCCCCGPEGAAMDLCYQTGDCLELALEVSELCYH